MNHYKQLIEPRPPRRARASLPNSPVRWSWPENWSARRRTAVLIFLVWTTVGVFEALPEMLINSPWPVLIGKLFDAWAWALLTPAIMLIDRGFASRQVSVVRSVGLLLMLSVPFSLAHIVLAGALLYPIPQVWWSPLRNKDFAIYFFLGGWATYGAIIGALQASRFYNRYLSGQLQLERVERSLAESRLNALRVQLEPHFLFNALNGIASHAAASPELQDMIGNLGALLRHSLDCHDKAQIELAQEVSLLEPYISIQKARFGDRIEINVDAEPGVLHAMVPSMLLQPLVENAIRHGLEGRRSGGCVTVSASKRGNQLQIDVVDDGIGLAPGWTMERSGGHGLRVTRERLAALYPNSAGPRLAVRQAEGGGTCVTILVPLRGTDME